MSLATSLSDHEAAEQLRDRFRGLLLGLALGDALGSTLQHRRPGTFNRVADLLGGGPFDIPRGAWTDDAATALHCAESFIAMGRFSVEDIGARWTRWRQSGEGAATAQCLGISAALASALSRRPGMADINAMDGEPFPRVAIAAAFGLGDAESARHMVGDLTRLTHPSALVLHAADAYMSLILNALDGVSHDRLLAPPLMSSDTIDAQSAVGEKAESPLQQWRQQVDPVQAGSARGDAVGTYWVVCGSLTAGSSFKAHLLAAINTGGQSDIQGAATGALAGALYGARSLPSHWLDALFERERIEVIADRLLVSSLTRLLDESLEVSR